MRSFFWKFVLCLFPCALAAWVTTDAFLKYKNGAAGGFKLGVDLVGGTILVYEIDVRKSQAQETDSGKKGENARDIAETTKVLADSLKRRIDPNDLYNVVIRPAGGEGRVEIILPTGGTHRAKKAEDNWKALLDEMKQKYDIKGPFDVSRGHILELAERIQVVQSEEIWEKKLYGKGDTKASAEEKKEQAEAWALLKKNARDYEQGGWAELDDLLTANRLNLATNKMGPNPNFKPKALAEWDKLPQGDLKLFGRFIEKELAPTSEPTSEKTVQTWIRKQAWEEMMRRARQAWPELAARADDMSRIPVDNIDQLTTFIQARGNIIGQAGLNILEPLVGADVLGASSPSAEKVRKFISENYGPSAQKILEQVHEYMKAHGQTRDLSVEEVQRIKDLVAKVGKLEFRILANSNDDQKGIEAAQEMINNPNKDVKRELEEDQRKGLPPPAPTGRYTIDLARSAKSAVTYVWVELGPQERRQLNLDNAAKNDPARNAAWVEAKNNRNRAVLLPDPAGGGATGARRYLLEGALFYSREAKDQNLPEEERRSKEVEYFVLARDPEFLSIDSPIRTRAITGDFLVNAYNAPGSDMRPTVHFSFDNEGASLFGDLTRKNVVEETGGVKRARHLAIVLDGLVMSAPTIQSEIRNQGTITGSFTPKEVDSLVNILRAGRLPATLKPQPVSESTIAATLGEDTINAGLQAIGLSFGAVLLFMVVYYRFAGFVASVALLANLLLTVGFMVFVQATFTLPGLAGLVLMLGMAVDANILIYERLREERERGAGLAQAIRNGYDRALPTIIDTHLSSIFTAIVLYVVGNDQLKGFAISMTVGLLISLFTSLFMTRVMFDFWLSRGWLHKLGMFRLFAKPNLDFMSIRYFMFAATLVMSVGGLGLFIARLPNDLNIDFVGGTAYSARLTKPMNVAELRDLLEYHQKSLEGVKAAVIPNTEGRRYALSYPGDAHPYTVSLANPPDVTAPDEAARTAKREQIVAQRASHLPDVSVELFYPSFQETSESGKSYYFTARTSEKEVDLVAAMLDRLLRDPAGQPYLKKVYMDYSPLEGRETRLSFFDTAAKQGTKSAGSPVFVKSLLSRELKQALGLSEQTPLPFSVEVFGEGQATEDGKYHVLKVIFGPEVLNADRRAAVETALQKSQSEFNSRPQPDRLENFDSQLATETRFRALWAILASWAAIAVYLWFRFGNWTFGMAAVICLIHDLCFTLGAIAVCHYLYGTVFGQALLLEDFKIDLTAVAALLTLVGYSTNDTIVVFDRIREVRGKNPDLTTKMLNDSVNQTLSRTVLASLATWLVVFVLYLAGGPGVHLFAFVMVVGVIVGTYSSIYIASPLLLMFGEGTHEPTRPVDTRFQMAPR
jgi:SecD/SecF fusion protein